MNIPAPLYTFCPVTTKNRIPAKKMQKNSQKHLTEKQRCAIIPAYFKYCEGITLSMRTAQRVDGWCKSTCRYSAVSLLSRASEPAYAAVRGYGCPVTMADGLI